MSNVGSNGLLLQVLLSFIDLWKSRWFCLCFIIDFWIVFQTFFEKVDMLSITVLRFSILVAALTHCNQLTGACNRDVVEAVVNYLVRYSSLRHIG